MRSNGITMELSFGATPTNFLSFDSNEASETSATIRNNKNTATNPFLSIKIEQKNPNLLF